MTSDDLRSFYDAHYGRVVGAVALVTGSRAAAERDGRLVDLHRAGRALPIRQREVVALH